VKNKRQKSTEVDISGSGMQGEENVRSDFSDGSSQVNTFFLFPQRFALA
jgi:hypothetical protein